MGTQTSPMELAFVGKDGSFYGGGWINGEKSGKGRESKADGFEYEGEFLGGCRHGIGLLKPETGVDALMRRQEAGRIPG